MPKPELQLDHEVAELSLLLSVAIGSGLSLIGALEETFSNATGKVAEHFQKALARLELGGNLHTELEKLRSKNQGNAVGELALKLQLAYQFGSPISGQLLDFSRSLRAKIAQTQLTASAKRENLMLLPLVFLILPVTVMFAVFPALELIKISV